MGLLLCITANQAAITKMRWLVKLFGYLLSPAATRFHKSLEQPQQAQRKVQGKICDLLGRSKYGRSLGIKSLEDWERIPIVEYEDVKPWIEAQKSNAHDQLSPEPILFYERTSGSRSAAKFIPYTRSLKHSFSYMFCVWAHDLIQHGAKFSTGQAYFCVSPKLDRDKPSSEMPSEMIDDSEYLDTWLQWLLKPFLVSLSGLNQIRNPEEFKQKLCLTLLAAEDLEIISIWSPSFLQVQLDYIQSHQMELAELLGDRISIERLQLLKQPIISWTKMWRSLKLISCWDSAYAADRADTLRSLFPNVMVQGKGLLATEAPLTVPLIAAKGCVPMLSEVFFEFEDQDQSIHQLHELEIGKTYSIIISQQGGLYRYRLGDRIRVSHFYLNTPCLEFVGRTEVTSDLVGEKLHEDFVRDILGNIEAINTASFQSLVPVNYPTPCYVLLLDRASTDAKEIALNLEQALSQSHHYNHARLLGQLAPAQVMISSQIPAAMTKYKMQSQKWGDIKHQILVTKPISTELFDLYLGNVSLDLRDIEY
jgi:hypothetical protein